MSKNPKIVVFKLKELIYTGIFILLGILLIILFVWMFKSGKSKDTQTSGTPSKKTAELSDTSSTNSNDASVSDSSSIQSGNEVSANSDKTNTGNSSEGSSFGSGNDANTGASNQSNVNQNTTKETSDKKYLPGVYTSSLMLNNSALEIEVCVDADKINSVSIKNMDEAITTMYPLIENSMKDLENQIVSSQSLQNITYTDDCRYTYLILLDAVTQALSKAESK